MIKDDNLEVYFKGGGSFTEIPPVFSDNGQYVFVAFKNVIYSYNVKTGKRFLEFKGINHDIVGFGLFCMEVVEYLAACSTYGKISLWRIDTALKIFTIDLGQTSIKTFKLLTNVSRKDVSHKAVFSWNNDGNLQLGIVDLKSKAVEKLTLTFKTSNNYVMDIGGSSDDLYICVLDKNKLHFAKLNDEDHIYTRNIPNKITFSCVACHPQYECVLTGDSKGRVLLWQKLTDEEPSHSIFHWHTLPVKTVCFSPEGTTFFSGGSECVLVKWIADNSYNKGFLPRLPSYIQQLAVSNDNQYVAIATGDNALIIIDSQFHQVSNIQHLVLGQSFPAGITFDPRTRGLVMNGIPGHIQFYSPHDMHLLYNLDVSGMNKVTGERTKEIENVIVTKLDINRNGLWIATVEERGNPNELSFETRLKFWNFDTKNQTYILNTSVEYPHKKVHEIKFQPNNRDKDEIRCVSIGSDNVFKIWQIVDTSNVYNKGFSWRNAGVAYYKELTPLALAFSYDGSLLAVTFDDILTTWLPDSCEMKCSLVNYKYRETIRQVAFGVGVDCHLVLTASANQLCVWNLLTLSMIWTVGLKVAHLIPDSFSPHMAVFTRNKHLFIFKPSSPSPIYHKANISPLNILAAAFIPNKYPKSGEKWYENSQLFFIDAKQELQCLRSNEETVESTQFVYEETSDTLFSQITPQIKTNAIEQFKPVVHNFKKTTIQKLNTLLYSPVHTMAPVSLLCESVLRTMILESKKQIYTDSDVAKVSEIDQSSAKLCEEVGENEEKDIIKDLKIINSISTEWIASII